MIIQYAKIRNLGELYCIYVVVNFLSQGIFVFLLLFGYGNVC